MYILYIIFSCSSVVRFRSYGRTFRSFGRPLSVVRSYAFGRSVVRSVVRSSAFGRSVVRFRSFGRTLSVVRSYAFGRSVVHPGTYRQHHVCGSDLLN